MSSLPELDLFYGDLTVNRAYVYARLPRPAEDAGLSLVGQVRGPRCLQAETLPVTSPLVDLGPGPTLLARALIPDPCFWSADLPAIYDVTVHLLQGKEIIASARGEIGLRSLGVRGRNLALEGKRWVLRGIRTGSTTAQLPRHWHEASAAIVLASGVREHPDGSASSSEVECNREADASRSPAGLSPLAEASQWGALAIVEISGSPDELVATLRDLARYPAAAVAIVHGSLLADFKLSQVAPNLILAQPIGRLDELRVQPWAQMIVVAASDPLLVSRIAALVELPIIASRPLAEPLPIDEARATCDVLQRDLAPIGQFAGYIV